MATNETFITIEDANAEFRRFKFPVASEQEISFGTNNKPLLIKRKLVTFEGRNGTGSIAVPGLAISDRVRVLQGLAVADVGDQSGSFEAVITVADEIQQSDAANLTGKAFIAEVVTETPGSQM